MSTARAIALLQEAIAVLSGQVNAPATQAGVDAAAARYLADNPDVAKHIYFSRHPLEHYQVHGQAEGRKWPTSAMREPEPVTHPAWHDPESKPEAPQPSAQLDLESFTFGDVSDPLVFGTDDKQKYAANYDAIAAQLGQAAARAYLLDCVPGGAALFRSAWQSRGGNSAETARAINAHSYGATQGQVDAATNEFVYGGNPFTKEGGKRVKLPG